MLKSSDVLDVDFDEDKLNKLTAQRLKALKKACYGFVGHRFYCCEFHCELMFRDDAEKEQYKTFTKNIGLISKVQKKFNA